MQIKLYNVTQIWFCINSKGMWGQTSENEASPKKEIAWKQLKPSLHCGQNEMVFRATEYRAAEIQLDMGNVLH